MNRCKLIIVVLTLGLISCSQSKDSVLSDAKEVLSSEKAISYCVERLTVEGKHAGDTISTSTKSVFQKLENDSLCGFTYLIEDYLIHPRFKVPMTTLSFYNGYTHTWDLDSELKKDRKVTERQDISLRKLENDRYGQVPYILDILNLNGFTLTDRRDTVLNTIPYLFIRAVSEEGDLHELYIDKQTSLPKLLRIVLNAEASFFREFHYGKFQFSDVFEEPVFSSSETTEEVVLMGVGDVIPDWELETTDGPRLLLSESRGKTTVLFLSAVYCGACHKAIPTIKNVFDKCMLTEDLDCIVFYPDDEKERLLDYISDNGITYPLTFNPSKDKKQRYELRNSIVPKYPTTIILNSKNEMVWRKTSFGEGLESDIEKALEKVMHN